MAIKTLTEDFAVSSQLDTQGIKAVIDAGYRTIICNRPDSEAGAIAHTHLKQQAAHHNVALIYQPVVGHALTPADARHMADILKDAPKPVLAYCRSGARCEKLYDMVQQL